MEFSSATQSCISRQFGFQGSLETHDAVFDLLTNVYRDLNDGRAMAAVIKDWFDCNKLTLNINKTHVMGFRCDMAGLHELGKRTSGCEVCC